jgi:glycosyltransferase involved in cell wall biosynthesis
LVYSAVTKVFSGLRHYNHEIIFVDDGSRDNTLTAIKKLSAKDALVRYLEFSRNFSKEAATSAGINYARGDAAIMIDADMQHPPRLIPKFLDKWEAGADIVIGVREKNEKTSRLKKLGSSFFYKIINRISDTKITPGATDFRLISRPVISEMNFITEKNRMTRAIIDWLGYKRDFVYFTADARVNGQASYSYLKLIKLAVDSIVSMSLLPLRLAGYLGLFIIITSGPLGLFILIEKYLLNDPLSLKFSGPAILAVIILFLVGVILACLGLISLYIANIHAEVLNRPLYVVRNSEAGSRPVVIFPIQEKNPEMAFFKYANNVK